MSSKEDNDDNEDDDDEDEENVARNLVKRNAKYYLDAKK